MFSSNLLEWHGNIGSVYGWLLRLLRVQLC